jgi:hypothetical protein
VVNARLRLARGASPELPAVKDVYPLPPWTIDDTRAQLAIARDEATAALALTCAPITRLRAYARLGDEANAAPILDVMTPSRIEAMCRLFPGDPVTLLVAARRQARSPYR